MGIFILTLCAFVGGALPVFFYYQTRKVLFDREKRKHLEQVELYNQRTSILNESLVQLRKDQEALANDKNAFNRQSQELRKQSSELLDKKVKYHELQQENQILKRDIRNLAVHLAKQDLEYKNQERKQQFISAKSDVLGRKYLNETIKWIDGLLTQHNFSACKQRLADAINWCREIGIQISNQEEEQLHANLKADYEMVVRAAFEREEQARIRAQIREEQEHEREVQRAIEEAEREKRALEAALVKLKAEADGKHTEEIRKLEAQLAEAIAKSQRAISQAQLTKAGNVYVISNIGSLGNDIFKIGMTRRLEPLDRVRELGSASVPFPYDVHMMIATENAPALENALHRAFHRYRVNKTNPRKEFFKVTFAQILEVVKREHGEVVYTADAEALQYRQSINMQSEDQEFIEQTFEKFESDTDAFVDED